MDRCLGICVKEFYFWEFGVDLFVERLGCDIDGCFDCVRFGVFVFFFFCVYSFVLFDEV